VWCIKVYLNTGQLCSADVALLLGSIFITPVDTFPVINRTVHRPIHSGLIRYLYSLYLYRRVS